MTWLVEQPQLYRQISKYISPKDFTEGLYEKVADRLFEELEQGNINLDESVELYAQASKLVVACQKKLGAAQLKLEKLEPKPMEEKQEQKEEQDV